MAILYVTVTQGYKHDDYECITYVAAFPRLESDMSNSGFFYFLMLKW